VSLTEDPEFEIPVAAELVKRYNNRTEHKPISEISKYPLTPFEYNKRKTNEVLNFGGTNVPRVVTDFCMKGKITPASFFALGYQYSVPLDKWNITELACDYVFLGDKTIDFEVPGTLGLIYNYKTWVTVKNNFNSYPFIDAKTFLTTTDLSEKLNIVYVTLPDVTAELIQKLKNDSTAVLMIDTYNKHGMAEQRKLFIELINNNCTTPVIIGRAYGDLTPEQLQLHASTDIGALLVDGLGDGIFIAAENSGSDKMVNDTAFGILQATRTRISKTEYISCPSCGRTLFDLQETTAKIRAVTSHLKGVKIGIMGCIVNGPGEMADADYGYVGTGVGKITLYKEKEVVKRNVPESEAVKELINLIKTHGDWVEKE
jgi:(E)-4-hydroxy-3-methylbut-2-enyl-diphosphate synthase